MMIRSIACALSLAVLPMSVSCAAETEFEQPVTDLITAIEVLESDENFEQTLERYEGMLVRLPKALDRGHRKGHRHQGRKEHDADAAGGCARNLGRCFIAERPDRIPAANFSRGWRGGIREMVPQILSPQCRRSRYKQWLRIVRCRSWWSA